MLHPSRILIFLLAIYLLLIGVFTWNEQVQNVSQKISNPMMIISEPRVTGVSQSFLASPVNSDYVIDVRTSQFPFYEFGTYVNLSGKTESVAQSNYAKENPGYFLANNISHTMYYPEIKIVNYQSTGPKQHWYNFRSELINIRKSLEKNISLSLPEPQAGLLSGILLGTRSDLSKETKELLARVGIIHIIALSGYNITIIAEAMRLILRRHSAKLSFWGSLIGVWVFVFATGFSASAVRAAIMGSLLLLAQKLGRKSSALITVLLASAIMVAVNPYILLYDIGFQLSFAAVCGILFFAPRISNYFTVFGKTVGPVVATIISAQLFTVPLISYYFGRVSIVSPLANILITPLIPMIMLIGFLGAVVSYVSVWLGGMFFAVDWYLLKYIFVVTDLLAKTKLSEIVYMVSPFYLVLMYLVLFELILFLRKRDIHAKKSI